MRVASIVLIGLAAASLALPGCGPAVSKSELGNVVFTVPDVPGADQPYPLPEVKAPPGVQDPMMHTHPHTDSPAP